MRDFHSNSAHYIKHNHTDDTQLYLTDCHEKQVTARHKEDLWHCPTQKRAHSGIGDKFLPISMLKCKQETELWTLRHFVYNKTAAGQKP